MIVEINHAEELPEVASIAIFFRIEVPKQHPISVTTRIRIGIRIGDFFAWDGANVSTRRHCV